MNKKTIFAIILLITVLASGCAKEEVQVEEPEQVQEAPAPEVKEFEMEARRFAFEPGTITVSKGDTVRLKITSSDVTHGFAIDEYDINEKLPSGQEVIVEFVADKAGTFDFYCSVYCGSGHREMDGVLVVE